MGTGTNRLPCEVYALPSAILDMCILHIQIEAERIRFCIGRDGRIRSTVPPKVSGVHTNVIIIRLDFNEIRAVSQGR